MPPPRRLSHRPPCRLPRSPRIAPPPPPAVAFLLSPPITHLVAYALALERPPRALSHSPPITFPVAFALSLPSPLQSPLPSRRPLHLLSLTSSPPIGIALTFLPPLAIALSHPVALPSPSPSPICSHGPHNLTSHRLTMYPPSLLIARTISLREEEASLPFVIVSSHPFPSPHFLPSPSVALTFSRTFPPSWCSPLHSVTLPLPPALPSPSTSSPVSRPKSKAAHC
ncbi:unnamed protein product [Closterium sp. Naga37s-1]|nr:unnamed protein product [Closterium sp. Naga37s-1]